MNDKIDGQQFKRTYMVMPGQTVGKIVGDIIDEFLMEAHVHFPNGYNFSIEIEKGGNREFVSRFGNEPIAVVTVTHIV